MDDGEPLEELNSEPDDSRRPSRWLLLPVLAVLAVGWWLLPHPQSSPPVPLLSPTPVGSPTGGYQPGLTDAIPTLETVCDPVTDGRHRLKLRFVLINRSGYDLKITKVQPTFPLGGLRLRHATVVRGGCGAPLGEPLTLPLESGSEALVVFDLGLGKDCPQPLPVQAVVTSRVPDEPRSTTVTNIPVYPDLGDIDFRTCH